MKNNSFLLNLGHNESGPQMVHLRMVSEFAAERTEKEKMCSETFYGHNVEMCDAS